MTACESLYLTLATMFAAEDGVNSGYRLSNGLCPRALASALVTVRVFTLSETDRVTFKYFLMFYQMAIAA